MKGKGRGWHGDSKEHALAAQGIPTRQSTVPIGKMASASDMTLANKVLNALYHTEETDDEAIEVRMAEAIEQMEEVALGPSAVGIPVSKTEIRKAYDRVDSLLTKVMGTELADSAEWPMPTRRHKKAVRDVRTAARIAKAQL